MTLNSARIVRQGGLWRSSATVGTGSPRVSARSSTVFPYEDPTRDGHLSARDRRAGDLRSSPGGSCHCRRPTGPRADVWRHWGRHRVRTWPVTVVPRSGAAVLRYLRYALACFGLARSVDVVLRKVQCPKVSLPRSPPWIARKPLVLRVPGDYAWEVAMRTPGTELLDDF